MKQTVGERIAEDWACGRLSCTVAEAIDKAIAKAKTYAVEREAVTLETIAQEAWRFFNVEIDDVPLLRRYMEEQGRRGTDNARF